MVLLCGDNGSFYIIFQCFELGLTLVDPILRQSNITCDFVAQCSMFTYSTVKFRQ